MDGVLIIFLPLNECPTYLKSICCTKICVWKTFTKSFFLYIISDWTVHLEGMLPSFGTYSFELFSTIIYFFFQLTNNTKCFWRISRGLSGLQKYLSVAFLKLICRLTHLWDELAHFGAQNIICFSNLKISSGLLSAPSSLQYCWPECASYCSSRHMLCKIVFHINTSSMCPFLELAKTKLALAVTHRLL